MMLIDTSVLVGVMRDKTGISADRLLATIGQEDIAVTRMIEMELLAGALNEKEWSALKAYLLDKSMLELEPDTWSNAARMYFNLRRGGVTIRKLFDCCIAQVVIENGITLVHNDRDFDAIATLGTLNHIRIDITS